MKRDLILTSLTQLLAIISLIISFKIVAFLFSEEGFLLYSITRRNISLIILVLGLGIAISLIKHISSDNLGEKEKKQYLVVATYILLIIYAFVGALFFMFQTKLSYILYADYKHTELVLASYLAVGGLLGYSVVYAFYRGELNVYGANLVDIMNHALIPVGSIFVADSIAQVFLIMGGGQILFSMIIFAIIIGKTPNIICSPSLFLKQARSLLNVGVVRVPAEAGLVALLMFSTILITHLYGIKTSGYFAFSLTIVTTINYIFLPIGIVLLPRLSKLQSNKNYDEIIKIIKISLLIVISGSLVILAFIYLFIDNIFKIAFPELNETMIDIILLTVVSSLGFSVYSVSKNIIDALHNKGLNSYNIFYTLLLFLFCLLLRYFLGNESLASYILIFDGSLMFLGGVSLFSISRILSNNPKW